LKVSLPLSFSDWGRTAGRRCSAFIWPLPGPVFSIGVGLFEGAGQVFGVLVQVLAKYLQPHGVAGKGLHLRRVLKSLPA
jgi:hypothetical protein